MDDYENQILRQALEHFGYNITKTADALGLRRQSLQYRIKKYGIII
ncbi:MAG: helix-turn-helix domain-containing protein [Blautia sp.]|nr:helix-turn-helix domain-containing protein [Blautia sp.]